MILIYNITGLLVGVLGLFVGFVVAFGLIAIGSPLWLSPAALTIAGVWCPLGRAKPNFETGEMRPAPSVFFIPLFYWGLVAGFLSLPLAAVELLAKRANDTPAARQAALDPRLAQFKRLENDIRKDESDDLVLSALVMFKIKTMLPSESVNIAIKSAEDRVLVLIQLKDLKKIQDSDRKLLLKGIRETAENHRAGVKVYAGIKGRLMFGAITVPQHPDLIGSVVEEKKLLAFFDQPANGETKD